MFLPVIILFMSYVLNSFISLGQFAIDIAPLQAEILERGSVDRAMGECANVFGFNIARFSDYFLERDSDAVVLNFDSSDGLYTCHIYQVSETDFKNSHHSFAERSMTGDFDYLFFRFDIVRSSIVGVTGGDGAEKILSSKTFVYVLNPRSTYDNLSIGLIEKIFMTN
jgi:hypothetical protein